MKFVVIRKKILIVALLILIVAISLSINFDGGASACVYFNRVPRLVPVYSVDTDEKKVAISFDSAWGADKTLKIIEILKQYECRGTFFLVGFWVDKYPEAVKKIHAAGHEIANHSNKHPHVNKLSLEENISEIKQCSEKVKNLTGTETVLYRAPYGEYNNTVINAAKEGNHLAIQWNLDTLDYTGIEGQDMWQRLQDKIKSGSIILMHNGTKHTADSLEMLIKNINNKGLKIVKVSDLIYKENYIIDNNGAQKLVNV